MKKIIYIIVVFMISVFSVMGVLEYTANQSVNKTKQILDSIDNPQIFSKINLVRDYKKYNILEQCVIKYYSNIKQDDIKLSYDLLNIGQKRLRNINQYEYNSIKNDNKSSYNNFQIKQCYDIGNNNYYVNVYMIDSNNNINSEYLVIELNENDKSFIINIDSEFEV